MDRDQRPANAMQDLKDLQRDLVQAQGSAGKRGALTQASKGWIMAPMSAPDPPAVGSHLFIAMDGDPYVIDEGGIISPLKTSFPLAAAVANPPNFTSAATAGATYNSAVQNMLTDLRADAAALKIAFDNLLTSLRNGDVIAP